jgi:protein ImuB
LGFAGITILPSGKEAERLASLHLEILSPPPEMAELLADWGIRTLGALAELPPIALSARLGQEGLRLQQLARGETDQLLIPCEEPPVFLERCELEEALENLEPLCFLLHRMLQQLLGRLAEHSLATQELHLRFELATYPDRQLQEPALGKKISLFERILKLPVPTLDCAALFKLLQLDLAEHPPSQPVQKIEMQALPARMRAAQGNIFLPTAPQPEKLEVMLARIRAVVGEGRVGSAKLLDTHQPDAFVVAPFGSGAEQTSPPKLLMAYRRFRPPRPIALESAGGRITRIRLGRRVRPVRAFSGPWRSSGTWWEPSARWQREEWELSLANPAGLYRIFQDSESQQWFAEGMYD